MTFRQRLEILATILALGVPTAVQAGAIVVSKDSPLANMSEDDARRVFLGHVGGIAGNGVTVVFQHEGPTRTEFETKVLGKTGPELSQYWAMLIFTGKAAPPLEVYGDSGVRARIAGSPNVIGYVSDEAVDGSMKVLMRY